MRGLSLSYVKWAIGIGFTCLVGLCVYVLSPFPINDHVAIQPPVKVTVPVQTKLETQGHNQCAAFSTAFVLRNVGKEISGLSVYDQIAFKVPISGYVLPKGVLAFLNEQGLVANIYKGDLNTLKVRLSQRGSPIIVLVGNGLFWQHYMTLVGFDSAKQELYFVDSKKDTDENGELPGNRTMKEDYFMEWWSNGLPVFNHVFITVGE